MRAKRSLAVVALMAVILIALWVALQPGDEDSGDGAGAPAPVAVSPRVGPTIKLGPEGQVTSLLFADGSIWVARYDVPGPDTVARIDPATNEVVARISLEAAPSWEWGGDGMATGSGAVWVTGGTDRGALLQRIDPATNQVAATIPLDGKSGGDVAVDDSGVWVSAFGREERMMLLRVDPGTNRVVATIPIPGIWVREVLTVDGAIVVRSLDRGRNRWTVGRSRLTVIDPATNEVVASRPIGGANEPFGAWDGSVWAGAGRGLLRIDPHTAQRQGERIPVGRDVAASSLVAGAGGFWFVGYEPSDETAPARVDRFNSQTERIDVSVDPPKRPIALALAPDSIWVLSYEGSVTRIDL